MRIISLERCSCTWRFRTHHSFKTFLIIGLEESTKSRKYFCVAVGFLQFTFRSPNSLLGTFSADEGLFRLNLRYLVVFMGNYSLFNDSELIVVINSVSRV